MSPESREQEPMIELVLVRSGATDWDDGGRLQGDTDLPLSEPGREALNAALDLGLVDAASGAAVVLHGPDEASRQTAHEAAIRLSARTREVAGLRDVNLGLWAGLRDAELAERQPSLHRQWRDDPASVTPPEGENLADAEDRALAALAKALSRTTRGPVVVVLRPMLHALLRSWLRQEPMSRLWEVADGAPAIERLQVDRDSLTTARASA